jgi:TRAP-type mannitol/chloroaromatic compound transport system substrate-binding protein
MRLVREGVKLRKYSSEIMEAAYKAAMDLYNDESGKNPAFKKIYTEYVKYQKMTNQWFGVAEQANDVFIQAHLK